MITSTGNTQIRNLAALKKKAKERDRQDVFIVEGPKMFREAPRERIEQVYVSQSFLKDGENRAMLEGGVFTEVSDAVFEGISDTRTPQGILCVVKQFHYSPEDLMPAGGPKEKVPLLLLLESIQDPGNLGTMIRTAEGAGVTGILLCGETADIYNPKVIRATMGSIYRMPFFYTEDTARETARWKRQGIRIYAAHLDGKRSYDAEDLTGPCAFMIGNEGNGLSSRCAALADTWIRIPMGGQVESLNAAVAASVLLFEASRQRRTARPGGGT